MTMCNPDKVIQVATNEIGYLEKKSNSQLDSKTANAGKNNYTKYNRDYMAWDKQGVIDIPNGSINMEWCAAFVSWIFVIAFGLKAAAALLCGGLHCYTPTGASRFKKAGRYIKRGEGKPQKGDVVFFFSSTKGRIGHVGIVYKVSGNYVYTIEGNTSGASTLVTNGGGVKKKSYKLTSTYIDGYGRPDYASIESGTGEVVALELGDRLLENGCEGDDVKDLQEALINLGYDLGKWGADGDFGDATEMAVEAFQKDHGCEVDGQYGSKSHAAMVKALEALKTPTNTPKTVLIVGGNCWVRTESNTGGKRLGVACEGNKLEYQGATSDNGWHKVTYKNQSGWVSGKYSKLT